MKFVTSSFYKQSIKHEFRENRLSNCRTFCKGVNGYLSALSRFRVVQGAAGDVYINVVPGYRESRILHEGANEFQPVLSTFVCLSV